MATISDTINQGLDRLSTSPLGMASLGLLLQPSMSREPINPFKYAAQGMQLGIQNRQAKQQALAQQEQDKMQRARYLMEIQKYQQEELKMRQAQEERARKKQAMQEFMSTLSPEEARMAAVMGPKYAEQMMQQKMQPNQNRPAALMEYDEARNQGFTGSYMDFINAKRGPQSQYFQAIPTSRGLQVFDTRTGQVVGTQGETPAAYDPNLQGQIAEQKAAGTTTGEQTAVAKLNLPSYLASSEQMLEKVKQLIAHPGMNAAVGAPSLGKLGMFVPGSDASNFMARLGEVQGGQFLEAFNTLKGGGAITQTEGQKATQAISRMSTSQSEEEFVQAANDFMKVVESGISRAKLKAGSTTTSNPQVKGYPRGTVRERR